MPGFIGTAKGPYPVLASCLEFHALQWVTHLRFLSLGLILGEVGATRGDFLYENFGKATGLLAKVEMAWLTALPMAFVNEVWKFYEYPR